MRAILLVLVVFLTCAAASDAGQPSPVITVRIQAIRVSDDDGERQAGVTAVQIRKWVDFANQCYAAAGIRFLFDQEDGDFGNLKSTLLNDMDGVQDGNWKEEEAYANKIAAQYPDRLLVICRYGPDSKPTGRGFSWFGYNFVSLGGFTAMDHCGHAHQDALAHEIGHYLGLAHTFTGDPFPDVAKAEEYLKSKDNDPACFDGDGLNDTPPDPAIRFAECERTRSITLNDIPFVLPRRNLMSYYDERDSLSPQQITRARWFLQTRIGHKMSMPSNRNIVSPIEAETLKGLDRRECGECSQDMSPWGAEHWSGGKQLFCAFGRNSSITFLLPVTVSGTAELCLYATQSPDFGKVQVFVDDRPVGKPFDAYAPIVTPSGRIPLGTVDLNEGEHRLRFDVVGKNTASTDYKFGLDCIELTR